MGMLEDLNKKVEENPAYKKTEEWLTDVFTKLAEKRADKKKKYTYSKSSDWDKVGRGFENVKKGKGYKPE